MAKYEFFGKSDVGLKRNFNEDAFAVRPDLHMCLAADGMGGAAAGELASIFFVETAVKVFEKAQTRGEDEITSLVKESFALANRNISDHVQENPHHKGMGCTAELLAFTDNGFVIGHIGDSRSYRMRNGKLKQLTHDHSLVQEQVDQGLISAEEAKTHAMRNVVLRAIGVDAEIALDVLKGKALPGDQFLLCSDGLTDMVSEEDIERTLSLDVPLAQKVDQLISLANQNGGSDNITAVMACVLPE